MIDGFRFSRRVFFERSGTTSIGLVAGLSLVPDWLCAKQSPPDESALIRRIADAEVRAGVEAALAKNLVPAASERPYPGHFTITADGNAYGGDATWPGLDSWQMAGAYLLLGRTRLVLDYFEFVRASQRKDGNIPFAIFPGSTRPDGSCLRGLKYPDDVFTYTPPKREGPPASSQQTRTWIGLFEHWQSLGYPLSVLAPICYVLTAAEIFEATGSVAWLRERLGSLEAAAKYVLSYKTADGLIGGSGFYTEAPPRNGCDGVTQCYAVPACRRGNGAARSLGSQALSGTAERCAFGIRAGQIARRRTDGVDQLWSGAVQPSAGQTPADCRTEIRAWHLLSRAQPDSSLPTTTGQVLLRGGRHPHQQQLAGRQRGLFRDGR